MTERTFRIQTGHWHDNQGGHGMSLHVEDELSGVTVLDLQLTAEQAYDFMRGSTQTVQGNHSPRLDRVGKQMMNQSVTYDSKALGDHFWSDRDAKLAHAVELAKTDLPGWESYEPRHTNSAGVTVVVRKWVQPDSATCPKTGRSAAVCEDPTHATCPDLKAGAR